MSSPGVCQHPSSIWSVTLPVLKAYQAAIPHLKEDSNTFHMTSKTLIPGSSYSHTSTSPIHTRPCLVYLAWIVRGQRERSSCHLIGFISSTDRVMCCSPICALRCSLPLPPSVPLSLTWPISPRASERPTVRWRDGECLLASSQTKRHLAVFVAAAAAAGGRGRGCYAIPEFRCPSADAGGEFLMRPPFRPSGSGWFAATGWS